MKGIAKFIAMIAAPTFLAYILLPSPVLAVLIGLIGLFFFARTESKRGRKAAQESFQREDDAINAALVAYYSGSLTDDELNNEDEAFATEQGETSWREPEHGLAGAVAGVSEAIAFGDTRGFDATDPMHLAALEALTDKEDGDLRAYLVTDTLINGGSSNAYDFGAAPSRGDDEIR